MISLFLQPKLRCSTLARSFRSALCIVTPGRYIVSDCNEDSSPRIMSNSPLKSCGSSDGFLSVMSVPSRVTVVVKVVGDATQATPETLRLPCEL